MAFSGQLAVVRFCRIHVKGSVAIPDATSSSVNERDNH